MSTGTACEMSQMYQPKNIIIVATISVNIRPNEDWKEILYNWNVQQAKCNMVIKVNIYSHVPDHITISSPSELPVALLFGAGLSLPAAPWVLAVMIDPLFVNADCPSNSFWVRFPFRLTNLLSTSPEQHRHPLCERRSTSAQLCVPGVPNAAFNDSRKCRCLLLSKHWDILVKQQVFLLKF